MNNTPSTPADGAYPPWENTGLIGEFIARWRYPAFMSGLATFLVYWGLPFAFAAQAGTLISREMFLRWLANAHWPAATEAALREAAAELVLDQAGAIAYLNDRTHCLFALAISVGSGLAAHIARQFHVTVRELRDLDIPRGADQPYAELYDRHRRFKDHWIIQSMAALLALITFAIFVKLSHDPAHRHWWGYQDYGYAGYALAAVVSLMVYWGSRAMAVLGLGSLMLARLMQNPLILRPFHPDGCNGLAPLGRLIIWLWLFALALAFAIYVTLRFGYLGIEKTLLAWLLAAFGTLTIPALALLPLWAALKSIQTARLEQLAAFEPLLHDLLQETITGVRQNHCEDALSAVEKMEGIKSAQDIINTANVWPFNPRALAGILLVNVIQIILTARELLSSLE